VGIDMTWDLPWVASGSAEIPLDVARAFTYAATDGVSGIIGQPFSGVLKITQTASPSGNIQTAAGAFVAVSAFAGATTESYVGRNDATVTTSVPATTASSRSDLVYAHITDPSQAGQPSTASVVQTRIITNVPSNTTSLNSVSGYENQTGLALARIDRPAGTSTVSQSQIIDLRVSALPSIVGDLKVTAALSSFVPPNWVFADGRALSRAAYPELFAMIGTSFGSGDGTTTFNVPDYRGRTIVGAGAGPGLTNRALGTSGGAEKHALTEDELASHRHQQTAVTNTLAAGGSALAAMSFGGNPITSYAEQVTSYTGNGTPHNNMQPWTASNILIRVK
jgi:microcystin-dependent protein